MKNTEKFFNKAVRCNNGRYTLDMSIDGNAICSMSTLRNALRKEGYKTRVDGSGDVINAIPKSEKWHRYYN